MLTARLPFSGPDFVGQHLGATPPAPSVARPGLPPAWDALVARMLRKTPAERFPSLEELTRALQELPRDTPAQADPPTAAPPAIAPDAAPRYASIALLSATDHSSLELATDTRLGRQVVIERFSAGFLATPAGEALRAWLRAMARAGGPGLQRLLTLDDAVAVYEAVAGPPAARPLGGRGLGRLRRVLHRLHAEGAAHGSVSTSIVTEEHGPTLLVAGRGPTARTALDDDRELAALA
jgi:hypothetical protein